MSKICLCIVCKDKNNKYYEALFDDNLSIDENLNLLKVISDIKINDNYYVIYDGIALDKQLAIKEFCIPQFSRLNLFNGKI